MAQLQNNNAMYKSNMSIVVSTMNLLVCVKVQQYVVAADIWYMSLIFSDMPPDYSWTINRLFFSSEIVTATPVFC